MNRSNLEGCHALPHCLTVRLLPFPLEAPTPCSRLPETVGGCDNIWGVLHWDSLPLEQLVAVARGRQMSREGKCFATEYLRWKWCNLLFICKLWMQRSQTNSFFETAYMEGWNIHSISCHNEHLTFSFMTSIKWIGTTLHLILKQWSYTLLEAMHFERDCWSYQWYSNIVLVCGFVVVNGSKQHNFKTDAVPEFAEFLYSPYESAQN